MATVQAQAFRLRRTQYSRQPGHASTTFLAEKRPMRGVESKASHRVTSPFQPTQTRWSLEALTALCQRQARVRMAGWLLHDFPRCEERRHLTGERLGDPSRHIHRGVGTQSTGMAGSAIGDIDSGGDHLTCLLDRVESLWAVSRRRGTASVNAVSVTVSPCCMLRNRAECHIAKGDRGLSGSWEFAFIVGNTWDQRSPRPIGAGHVPMVPTVLGAHSVQAR